MEDNIDDKKFRIEVKGSKKEIKKFARCLVEIVNENKLPDFEYLVNKKGSSVFNIDDLHRIYLEKNSLIYMPNGASDVRFAIIKQSYQKAKEMFFK